MDLIVEFVLGVLADIMSEAVAMAVIYALLLVGWAAGAFFLLYLWGDLTAACLAALLALGVNAWLIYLWRNGSKRASIASMAGAVVGVGALIVFLAKSKA